MGNWNDRRTAKGRKDIRKSGGEAERKRERRIAAKASKPSGFPGDLRGARFTGSMYLSRCIYVYGQRTREYRRLKAAPVCLATRPNAPSKIFFAVGKRERAAP